MKISKFVDSLSVKTGILAVLSLSGCIATTLPYMRAETAQRIAAPAWMVKRDISATPYMLRSYERIHNRGASANIYIEGDGAEFTSPEEWENNPTPKNPVALHLASKDRADNVIYIARPCQYIDNLANGDSCSEDVWKDNRFSSEVISSFNVALNDIARRYDIDGFNLIGYSGGGAIATVLAEQRKDILSIRTVAGTLDTDAQRELLGKPKLTNSINPTSIAVKLAKIPQYHFIGGQDKFAPPAVLQSYTQAMPPTNCVQTMLVQEASYDKGWVDKWPELLELPVTCYNKDNVTYNYEPMPEMSPPPIFKTMREKPLKP